jgi:ribosomal protein S18 acetylase RimI-like enzyme
MPSVRKIPIELVDSNADIFNSLTGEYPGFLSWIQKTKSDTANRSAYVAGTNPGQYDAVAIVKLVDTDGPSSLHGVVSKISTFKVADGSTRKGLGTALLDRILADTQADALYLEIYPHHQEMIRWLQSKGFCIDAEPSPQGEFLLFRQF